MSGTLGSRFAVLKIEGDKSKKKSKSNKIYIKSNDIQHTLKTSKDANKIREIIDTDSIVQQEKKKNTERKKKKKQEQRQTNKQWSTWKEKDSEILNENFEDDLEKALLLSKIDFEANKTKYTSQEKQSASTASASSSKSSMKKKLSLQEFTTMLTDKVKTHPQTDNQQIIRDDAKDFFNSVTIMTKQIVRKEQYKTIGISGKSNTVTLKISDPQPDQSTKIPSMEEMQKKDGKIEELSSKNESLTLELEKMKQKYGKLLGFVREQEVVDKVKLLIKIDKLQRSQSELSAEISSLHIQLEQERSKSGNNNYNDSKAKMGRKSVRFDAASEITSKD